MDTVVDKTMTYDEIKKKLTGKYPHLLPADTDELTVEALTDFCLELYEAGIQRGQELAVAEIRKMLARLDEASALKRSDK